MTVQKESTHVSDHRRCGCCGASLPSSDLSRKVWKRLRHHGTDGVGDIADQDYGLPEFTLTDPDGNRIRTGSPSP